MYSKGAVWNAEVRSIVVHRRFFKMYQIGNIYAITGISVIGGGLFGFDISSMSAM